MINNAIVKVNNKTANMVNWMTFTDKAFAENAVNVLMQYKHESVDVELTVYSRENIMDNMMSVNDLPEDVQAKVKRTLRCYDRVSVEYEDGKFHVYAGCIIANRGYDFAVIGEYKAEDVYTPEEREQNFYEEFGYHRKYA